MGGNGENTISFDGWLLKTDGVLIQFAEELTGVVESLRMSRNADIPAYDIVADLRDQAFAELEARGLLEDFKSERGMD
jgi:hypothetical protein